MEVGDYVKVHYVDSGWRNYCPSLDEYVGSIGRIAEHNSGFGGQSRIIFIAYGPHSWWFKDEWLVPAKLKHGDKVRITRVDENWDAYCAELKKFIGHEGALTRPRSDGKSWEVEFDSGARWWFATDWLERVDTDTTVYGKLKDATIINFMKDNACVEGMLEFVKKFEEDAFSKYGVSPAQHIPWAKQMGYMTWLTNHGYYKKTVVPPKPHYKGW